MSPGCEFDGLTRLLMKETRGQGGCMIDCLVVFLLFCCLFFPPWNRNKVSENSRDH